MNRLRALLDRLADLMVQKRWFSLLWNGGLVVLMSISAYLNIDQPMVVALDTFVIGAIFGSSLQLIFGRGLYKGLSDYETAMMKAEIEKNIELAWAEFSKKHPQPEAQVPPDVRFKQ